MDMYADDFPNKMIGSIVLYKNNSYKKIYCVLYKL